MFNHLLHILRSHLIKDHSRCDFCACANLYDFMYSMLSWEQTTPFVPVQPELFAWDVEKTGTTQPTGDVADQSHAFFGPVFKGRLLSTLLVGLK